MNRSAKIFRGQVGSSQKNRRAQMRKVHGALAPRQVQCSTSIPRVPPSTRRPTHGADRADGTGHNAHHHRAIGLDRQARHTPPVTPHKQILDVHRGPPAASLLAI